MRYLGVYLMIIGAIMIMLKAFAHIMPQNNLFLGISLALVLIGYILFIFMDKRAARSAAAATEDENVRITPIDQTNR